MRRYPQGRSELHPLRVLYLTCAFLASLIFASATRGVQAEDDLLIRDVAYIEGDPVQLTGYGLVIGLDGTGDGCEIAHTDQTLLATIRHLGIDPEENEIRPKQAAAVFVQAWVRPGAVSGGAVDLTLISLGDARDLSGGSLAPTVLQSRDGRFQLEAYGQVSDLNCQTRWTGPTMAGVSRGGVVRQNVFMTAIPGEGFVLSFHGWDAGQICLLAEHINSRFGQIATCHSGCDMEISLPAGYVESDERISLIAQIAELRLADIVPALFAGPDMTRNAAEY